MNRPDLDAYYAKLLELAESRFRAWLLREFHRELERSIEELKNRNLTSAGRATKALEIYRVHLEKEARNRTDFYVEIARESGCLEMFSKVRLNELRERIRNAAEVAAMVLKQRIETEARLAGTPAYSLPLEGRYDELLNPLRDSVNAELRVLEAEEDLAKRSRTTRYQNQWRPLPAPPLAVGGMSDAVDWAARLGAPDPPKQVTTSASMPGTIAPRGSAHSSILKEPEAQSHVKRLVEICAKKNITLEGWASGHRLGRTSVFDWKAARGAGTSLKGKVSDAMSNRIEAAIEEDAMALGLATRTSPD